MIQFLLAVTLAGSALLAPAPQQRVNPQKSTRSLPKHVHRSKQPRTNQHTSRRPGYELDASLEVGSGGYNRTAGGSGMERSLYRGGTGSSLYRVGRSGDMVYDPVNAFSAVERYNPAGTRTGTNFRRFRYY